MYEEIVFPTVDGSEVSLGFNDVWEDEEGRDANGADSIVISGMNPIYIDVDNAQEFTDSILKIAGIKKAKKFVDNLEELEALPKWTAVMINHKEDYFILAQKDGQGDWNSTEFEVDLTSEELFGSEDYPGIAESIEILWTPPTVEG